MMNKEEIKVGQKVFFGRPNGEKTLGTVIKINRAKCKVRQEEERGMYRTRNVGTVWTVPFSLMWPSDERPDYITKRPERRQACLVNIMTGHHTYGRPGETEDSLFGRLANGLME